MPSVEKQLLSIPFAKGLSQREDPRWLAPGALLTATNIVHPKTNIVEKRPGFAELARTGLASVPGVTRTLATGRRLARFKNALAILGADEWTDAVWVYDEGQAKPVLKDRVPEVYAFPDRVIAGGSDLIWDADTAVANGYAVHAWLVGAATAGAPPQPGSAGATDVFYQVESAATGEVLLSARSIGQVTNDAAAPKLIVVGQYFVLTYCSGKTDRRVYALLLDSLDPAAGFGTQVAVSDQLVTPFCQNGIPNYGAPLGCYDACAVTGSTTTFVVANQTGTATMPTDITISKMTIGGGIVTGGVTVNVGTTNDTQWRNDLISSDGTYATFGTLQGITVCADAGLDEVAVSYAWCQNPNGRNTVVGGTYKTSVSIQLVQYVSLGTSIAGAVDLTSAPMWLDPSPQTLAVQRIGQAGIHAGAYKVMFSPSGGMWTGYDNGGDPVVPGSGYALGLTTAYIASFVAYPSAGFMFAAPNQPRVTYGVRLASRIAVRNGIGYVVGYCPSSTQGTFFLFADDAWSDLASSKASAFPLRHVATFAPRLASAQAYFERFEVGSLTGFLPSTPYVPFVLPHLASNPTAQGTDVVQTSLCITQGSASLASPTLFAWDFASPLAYQASELGENMALACGAPSAFDGASVFELGFPLYPFIVSMTASNGGHLNPTGVASPYVISYIVTYEWRDHRGQIHRSARGITGSIDLGGKTNQNVTIAAPTMGFTAREKATAPVAGNGPQGYSAGYSPVTMRLYATEPNGATFYNMDPTDVVSGNSYAKANAPIGPTVSFVDDGLADSLTTHALLYGDGSDGTAIGTILDNFCPPAFQALIVHKNRFFGVDGSNIWASKAFTTGEGSAFNELMAFSVDDGPGPVTALASLDDKLIIWKSDRVFYVAGDGPNDGGGQNDWTTPQRIASNVGCVDWRSVVVTPQGVHFMSASGLRLLTRDLQVVPVVDVGDALTVNPAMTSAVVHPTLDRVLWTANVNDIGVPRIGIGIDHDYVLDSWMTSVVSHGVPEGAVSAAVAGQAPTYHQLRAGGTVLRESAASSLDGTTYAPMTIETAWIKSDGLASFARFRRLLVTWEVVDPHQLSVYVAYDFSPTYYLMGTVTATQMAAMTTPMCEQLFALPRQRAQAVRFLIADAPDAGVASAGGRGPRIVSLDIEWGAYTNRRLARLPGAQRS